jgi:tetratricopeptide (TPR) repeat protein
MSFNCYQWSLCAVLLVSGALLALPAQSVPRTPADDATVIEKLPFRAGDSRARELETLRASARKSPGDANAAAALAQAYFDMAQARSDPRYVGYADAVVSQFDNNMSTDLLVIRGMLYQYRHDFDKALVDFASALAQDPERAGAHAWRGAIYLVEAQYDNARKECAALLKLQRPVLHGGCDALVQAYTGQLNSAYATLQQALALARYEDQRLWLLTRLGEVSAWLGQNARAERHYRDALALGLDDGYLLAAWADFLLDTKRPAEVLKLLSAWEASDPLLLRLAEAETLLQVPAAKAHVQALDDRFAAAKLRGDTTHRAEEARFQLRLRKNPALAVQLAAANYHVQKEPRDLRVLLEAALAAHDSAAAKPGRDWLQSTGFEDARIRTLAAQTLQLPPVAKIPVVAP